MRTAFRSFVVAFTLALLCVRGATAQNPVYGSSARPHSAVVSVLAISTSIHSGAGGNQETYLADVSFKGSPHQMAKLVDTYPPIGSAIRRSLLADRHHFRMALIRDQDCDSTGKDFFLTADDSNIFDTNARSSLNDRLSGSIPCYQVIHDDTRLWK